MDSRSCVTLPATLEGTGCSRQPLAFTSFQILVGGSRQLVASSVTVIPQITCDAVYSGSDLFRMIVYSNELS